MKKLISTILILTVLVINTAPLPAYAQTPTPPPSDPTLAVVSQLAIPASESANQNVPQPSFDQMVPSSPGLVFTPQMFVLGLAKQNFQGKEEIEVTVKYAENKDVTVSVEGADQDAPIQIQQEKVNGDSIFTLQPAANLKPGKYTIKVIDNTTSTIISTQNFTWGVLAINTDKSIYLPNEKADISLAVLDDKGDMVCTAIVDLDIVSPTGVVTRLSTQDGSIIVNPACRLHQFSLEPDFQTSYQTTSTGRYTMTLTATTGNGSYSTKDRFEVRDSVAFDIQRETSTRIYPPATYPVRLKIHANEAFEGRIVESVPTAFQISQLEEQGVYGYMEESPILANIQYEKDYGIPDIHLPFNDNYPVSQGFGQQIDDPAHRNAYKNSGLDGHDGIDFALPEKTPIVAVDAGRIVLAKENWIYGTSIVIQHAWGRTYYGHLSKLEVTEGDVVTKGQEIGLSGSTGLSTGPHLHFGLKPKDSDIDNLYFGKIDPSKYLGIASEDPVLNVAEYPAATKALIWNVKIQKGADFVIGYNFVAPPKSPDFYTIGPLQFISSQKLPEKQARFDINVNPFVLAAASPAAAVQTDVATVQEPPFPVNQPNTKDRIIFQEIRPWQLAIDVATTVILTSASTNPWTVPNSWNSNDNKVEVVGAGGNGQNGNVFASYGGSGGGGGAYAYTTNVSLTPGGTASFQIGTGGSGTATWFSTSGTVNAGAGGNGNGGTGGSAGTVGTGTGYSGGTGGIGSGPDLGETGSAGGGGGGGGAAGPNGAGHHGRDGGAMGTNNLTCGGGGGGGNGGGSGADGGYGACSTTSTNATGGTGGNGSSGTGGGSAGSTSAGGAATTNSGGGGGGGSGTSTGTFYAGGNGAASRDMANGGIGSGGGGGGGGGNIRTSATGNDGGAGGNPTANSGAGGGGGGSCIDAGCAGGAGRTGADGYIVITWTPQALTLDQLMRHGKWFDNNAKASTFTF